jgi:hypothetical protein
MGRGEDEDALARRLKLAAEALSLVYAIWMIWVLVPEHRRKLAIMRITAGIQNTAGALASRTGTQAMSLEARTGRENYVLPYGFSLIREKAAAWYERLRYS